MGSRALQESQVLELLEDMSRMAKSAKKIEELAYAMDNIATQTTLLVLDTSVIQQRPVTALRNVGSAVEDASEEMLSQFQLLQDEVAELEKFIKSLKSPSLKENDLN